MAELIKNGIIHMGSGALYIVGIALCVIIPYLIGSVNFAVLVSRLAYGSDVRNSGSGNAGATNMLRTHGKKAAALTFGGDLFKAVLATFIGLILMPGDEFAYVAALFCMVGHAYPLYFGFKGGKGVTVMAGAVLVLNPLVFLICVTIFALIVAGTKFVSLGSITGAILFPILNYKLYTYFYPTPIKVIFSILFAVFVVFLHRKNIERLANGTESKIGKNKPNKLK